VEGRHKAEDIADQLRLRRSHTVAGRIADGLEAVVLLVAGSAFVLIAALIVGQVFMRYVLAAPPIWTEELTRYVFVWLAWLSAAVVFRQGQHVTIDALANVIPERLKGVHDILVRMICVAVLLFLLRYGIEALQFATNRSAALNITMIYVYASAPVASFIMLAFVALDAIDSRLGRRNVSAD
jgi:TRAP-type transport system small permease protein